MIVVSALVGVFLRDLVIGIVLFSSSTGAGVMGRGSGLSSDYSSDSCISFYSSLVWAGGLLASTLSLPMATAGGDLLIAGDFFGFD